MKFKINQICCFIDYCGMSWFSESEKVKIIEVHEDSDIPYLAQSLNNPNHMIRLTEEELIIC